MSIPSLSSTESVSDAKMIAQSTASPLPAVNPRVVQWASEVEQAFLGSVPLPTKNFFPPFDPSSC